MSWRDNDQPADERDWVAAVIAAADEPLDQRVPADESTTEDDVDADADDAVAVAVADGASEDDEPTITGRNDEVEDASDSVVVHSGSEAARLVSEYQTPPPAPQPPSWWSAPGVS